MLAPLSKGQMNPCPFANDNLSVDETTLSELRPGTRTDASESDLCCELTNKFWLINTGRTLAI